MRKCLLLILRNEFLLDNYEFHPIIKKKIKRRVMTNDVHLCYLFSVVYKAEDKACLEYKLCCRI